MIDWDPNSKRYDFDSCITISDIKRYFRYSNSGPFFTMFETGLDNNRFDMIRIDPRRQYIRIFEFKSCRQDFVSDKKWQNYLKYCHTFTFVSGREVIKKEDVPKSIGLLWVYKWKHKNQYPLLRTENNWMVDGQWVRRPRKRDVNTDILLKLAFMLVYRTIWRKEDVF